MTSLLKLKISEVLRIAANEHLAATPGEADTSSKRRFSCCAVDAVFNPVREAAQRLSDAGNYDEAWKLRGRAEARMDTIERFLTKLGVNCDSMTQFLEFEKRASYWSTATRRSQGARYLWLMFAAMIAEEEGR